MSAGTLLEVKCEARLASGAKFVIDVDISINKPLEMLNSALIHQYCAMDQRFHKVALVLKNWNRRIDGDKSKRLNSFSIYLLLLVFMLDKKYMIDLQAEAPRTVPLEVSVHTNKETKTTITTYADFLTDMQEIDRVMEQRLME